MCVCVRARNSAAASATDNNMVANQHLETTTTNSFSSSSEYILHQHWPQNNIPTFAKQKYISEAHSPMPFKNSPIGIPGPLFVSDIQFKKNAKKRPPVKNNLCLKRPITKFTMRKMHIILVSKHEGLPQSLINLENKHKLLLCIACILHKVWDWHVRKLPVTEDNLKMVNFQLQIQDLCDESHIFPYPQCMFLTNFHFIKSK